MKTSSNAMHTITIIQTIVLNNQMYIINTTLRLEIRELTHNSTRPRPSNISTCTIITSWHNHQNSKNEKSIKKGLTNKG